MQQGAFPSLTVAIKEKNSVTMETSEVDQAWINQNTMKAFCKVLEKNPV